MINGKYSEEEFLLLSGIQHFVFCRRQWALIHIEQAWQENVLTALGRSMHNTVHEKGRQFEKRGDTLITRSLPVKSYELGLQGICDVVEFLYDENGIHLSGVKGKYTPMPVEYKRGLPKKGIEDIVQVGAQAICLEEMLCCKISQVVLYYGTNKRRSVYQLDHDLREKICQISDEMHSLFNKKHVPRAVLEKKCFACSLYNLCLPMISSGKSVERYLDQALKET